MRISGAVTPLTVEDEPALSLASPGIPSLEQRPERAVKRPGSCLQQQVRSALRPLHLLALGKAYHQGALGQRGDPAGAVRSTRHGQHHHAGISRRAAGGLPQCRARGGTRRKRQDLLAATERDLARIQVAVRPKRNPLRGATDITLAVGAVINKHKMEKHFTLNITDIDFSFSPDGAAIDAEAATDGIYVVRTSLPSEKLDDTATVRSYKSLALVERAFRFMKTIDLHVRPIYHWSADRVRAHVCLCMLAYYVEWHMRQKLAPMLFDDTDHEAAEAERASIVAKAQRSPAAINDAALLARPNRSGDPALHGALSSRFDRQRRALGTAMRTQTEMVLRQLLPFAGGDLRVVARMLRTPPRSLQRKLPEEGASFGEILDRVRADLALSYLRDSELGVAEVAEILQFSETSALTRAFCRWYGVSPRRARAQASRPTLLHA